MTRNATHDRRVHFEVEIWRDSKAAMARLGAGIFAAGARILDSAKVCGTPVCIVSLRLCDVAQFREVVKPDAMLYRSPTYFDNGTIRPLFATPEEEVAYHELHAGPYG